MRNSDPEKQMRDDFPDWDGKYRTSDHNPSDERKAQYAEVHEFWKNVFDWVPGWFYWLAASCAVGNYMYVAFDTGKIGFAIGFSAIFIPYLFWGFLRKYKWLLFALPFLLSLAINANFLGSRDLIRSHLVEKGYELN